MRSFLTIGIIAIHLISSSYGVTPNCNCVVFRLDDIQDWWISAPQKAVIDVFKAGKIPLSGGIIGNSFGDDSDIVTYIQNALTYGTTNNWDFEILSHGWNHEMFSTFTLAQQKTLLLDSRNKILASIGNQQKNVTGFIAPYNDFNANTITAMKSLGYTIFSSQVELDPAPYIYTAGASLYHWPINSATSNIDNNDWYEAIPAEDTFPAIVSQIADYGFASVMMHPQEFSVLDSNHQPTNVVSTSQIQELRDLIQMCIDNGIKIVSFRNLQAQFESSSSSPPAAVTTGKAPAVTTGKAPAVTTGKAPAVTTGKAPAVTTGKAAAVTTGKAAAVTTGKAPAVTTGKAAAVTTGSAAAVTTGSAAAVTTGAVATPTPTPTPTPVGSGYVAFKLEQVEDWYHSAAAAAVLQAFTSANVPLTVGVIGNYFKGEDSTIAVPLFNALKNCSLKVEVAANGYTFVDYSKKSAAVQSSDIASARTAIYNVLGVYPTVFIPPMYYFNKNTITALASNGFKWMSSYTWADPAPYDRTQAVWRFPGGAATYDGSTGLPINAADTWAASQKQQSSQGFSVIAMTPDEFSNADSTVNTTAIIQLKMLIQMAQQSGRQLSLISELSAAYSGPATAWSCSGVSSSSKMAKQTAATAASNQKWDDYDDGSKDVATKTKKGVFIALICLAGASTILGLTVLVKYITERKRRVKLEKLAELHLN